MHEVEKKTDKTENCLWKFFFGCLLDSQLASLFDFYSLSSHSHKIAYLLHWRGVDF